MKKLMRKPAVVATAGLSSSQIDRREKAGLFPKRVRLGEKTVAWDADEVDEWVRARIAERDTAPPSSPDIGRQLVAAKKAKRDAERAR